MRPVCLVKTRFSTFLLVTFCFTKYIKNQVPPPPYRRKNKIYKKKNCLCAFLFNQKIKYLDVLDLVSTFKYLVVVYLLKYQLITQKKLPLLKWWLVI